MNDTKPALPSPTPASKRPNEQKAAALLALMDEKTLSALSGKLSPKHRDKLVEAVKSIRNVPQPELKRIATEFAARVKLEKHGIRGGEETANRVSSALYEGDNGAHDHAPQSADLDEMLAQLNQDPLWERVAKLPLKKLVTFFEDKSSTVLGLALQQLSADVASELASTLDDALVRESLLMVAKMGNANPIAVEAIERMVEDTLLAKKTGLAEEIDDDEGNPNAGTIANILNRLTNSRREKILETLKDNLEDPDMGEIASKVLSFEALEYRLPRNGIPVIFREVAEKDILVALKYALNQNDPVAEYLLGNISQRLAMTYRERMETMPDVDWETGEKAQSAVICKLLNIVEQGRINLIAPEDETERSMTIEEAS